MGLLPAETGTKLGYEDYHGDIFDENNKHVGHWNYDKNQSLYIGSFFTIRKRFYAPNVKMLIEKMNKFLSTQNTQP